MRELGEGMELVPTPQSLFTSQFFFNENVSQRGKVICKGALSRLVNELSFEPMSCTRLLDSS